MRVAMFRKIRGPVRVGFLCFLFCSPAASPLAQAAGPKRYDTARVVRVDIKTPAQLDALSQTGAVILDCIPGVGPMTALVTPGQRAELDRLGLRSRIIVENVQAIVDAQRTAALRADPFTDFFLDYHPYGDASTTGTIVWYMNELVTLYPTLASMINVGTTVQGRTIWGMRITNDSITDKPAVVYFSAEHAREWITPTVPTYFATYLLENYGIDGTVTDLVDNVEFFLIPVFNVDGYMYSWTTDRYWRKNRRDNGGGVYGVDLNRNWEEGWGGPGSSGSTSSQTYRGPSAFSEPETQALRDFFYAHSNVRAQLDIHSFSQLILWPYGYTPALPADQDVYAQVGMEMKALIYDVHGMVYSAGPIYTGIYPASGVSLDWTYAQLGILSYSYELRPASSGLGGFAPPADQIIPNNEEILPALLHLTNSDWVRAVIRFRFPEGIPATLAAGTDTAIIVDLIEQFESIVPGSARLHYRYDTGSPFSDLPLTPMGGVSYVGLLPGANCAATPEFYFSVTGDGGTTVTSPKGAPADGVYSASVTTGTALVFSNDLSGNPGWTTQGQWAWGQPAGLGGEYGWPDPTAGYTGNNVYGYNLSGDYAADLPEQHLTSPPIDCTGQSGVHLRFWRWLGVEQPAYDHASVRVSNNGVDWVTVWENNTEIADSSWTEQDIDISAVADGQPSVYLRWTMGPTDGAWQYCGWNLDDIQLTATVCEGFSAPTAESSIKNRYIAFVPGGSAGTVQAFRVTTVSNPLFPDTVGERKWVAPPDANGVARLQCDPTYENWGSARIDVGDRDIVPGAAYTVEATQDGTSFVGPVAIETVPLWGDVVGLFVDGAWTPPDGIVNVIDATACVEAFRHLSTAPPRTWCDVYPDAPDGVIGIVDIVYILDAFRAMPYPFSAPSACP